MKITIRPITPADEPAVRKLSRRIYDGKVEAERPPEWHLNTPTLVAETDAARWDQPAELGIVGHATYHTAMFLDETAVAPSHEGQGLARAFMAERVRIAQEVGCSQVFGSVHEKNAPMVHLLESFGFTLLHRVPDGYGTSGDALTYIKSLPKPLLKES